MLADAAIVAGAQHRLQTALEQGGQSQHAGAEQPDQSDADSVQLGAPSRPRSATTTTTRPRTATGAAPDSHQQQRRDDDDVERQAVQVHNSAAKRLGDDARP